MGHGTHHRDRSRTGASTAGHGRRLCGSRQPSTVHRCFRRQSRLGWGRVRTSGAKRDRAPGVGSGRLAEAASQIGFHWACAASKSPQRTNFLRQPFTGLAGAPLTQPRRLKTMCFRVIALFTLPFAGSIPVLREWHARARRHRAEQGPRPARRVPVRIESLQRYPPVRVRLRRGSWPRSRPSKKRRSRALQRTPFGLLNRSPEC